MNGGRYNYYINNRFIMIKKLLLAILVVLSGFMQAQTFSSGDGSQANPYLITSDADLQQLAADVNGGITYSGVYFKLTTDIDLSGINWIPIGTIDYSFNGKFDGCG